MKKYDVFSVMLFVWLVIVGFFLGKIIAISIQSKDIVSPLSEITPTPTPELSWNDEIRAIFPPDKAGIMIRICIAETRGREGKYAIFYEDNGTYSYGWCQVNSVHRPMGMNDWQWREYLENPKNHALEVYRIYSEQGFNAWYNSYQKVK